MEKGFRFEQKISSLAEHIPTEISTYRRILTITNKHGPLIVQIAERTCSIIFYASEVIYFSCYCCFARIQHTKISNVSIQPTTVNY